MNIDADCAAGKSSGGGGGGGGGQQSAQEDGWNQDWDDDSAWENLNN